MKNRHLAIFAGWQTAGFLVGMGAHHVDRVSWLISSLMLMPGTMASLYLFRPGGIGNAWPKWALFAIPVAINIALFVALLRFRRGKTVTSLN